MEDAHRDAIRESALRRGNCAKCGNSAIIILDGSQIGGMPGINYRSCGACGWHRAVTKRAKREILKTA